MMIMQLKTKIKKWGRNKRGVGEETRKRKRRRDR